MVEPLNYKRAITIVKRLNTAGHRPILVLTEDYYQYIVKTINSEYDNCSIINEFLCHYLLKIWEIPTPKIAAIKLNADILKSEFDNDSKIKNYSRICFGSLKIDNPIEVNELIDFSGKVAFKKLLNPFDIFKIGFFDLWIQNIDRKPENTNLLLELLNNKYAITCIDHAFAFDSITYDQLNTQFAFSYNESILLSSLSKSIISQTEFRNQWIRKTKDKFYYYIGKCKTYFDEIVKNVPKELEFTDDLKSHLHNFLFNENRYSQAFSLFSTIISDLK